MKSLYYLSLIGVISLVGSAVTVFADPGTKWDQQINRPERFKVLTQFGGAAVLDKETGRVWEQSPSTETFPWTATAISPGLDPFTHCYQLEVGGRKGWRVPTIEELASLVDTSQVSPTLPAGHPFNVQATPHWSSTTNASDASRAWAVGFATGTVFNPVKTAAREVWCVRGGQGIDGVQ